MPLPNVAPGAMAEVLGTALKPTIPTQIGGVDPRFLGGNAGPDKAIMTAWSGGLWVEALETFFAHGGGHADGAISNLFALPMSTLAWRIESPQASAYNLNDPAMGANGLDTNPDGTPCAIHSWGGLGYLPTLNAIFRTRGDRWSNSGGPTAATWRWGPVGSGAWTRLTSAPEQAEASMVGWHAASGKLLVLLSHWLWAFDPAGDGLWWQVTQQSGGVPARSWPVLDTRRNRLIVFSGVNGYDPTLIWPGQVSVVDLTPPWPVSTYIGQSITRHAMTGDIPTEWAVGGWTGRINGFYDEDRDLVVHWGGHRDWYLMDAAFNWTKVTAIGADIGSGVADRDGTTIWGLFGRVFSMRARGLYGVVTDVLSNLVVFNPSSTGISVLSSPTVLGTQIT